MTFSTSMQKEDSYSVPVSQGIAWLNKQIFIIQPQNEPEGQQI